MYILVKIKKKIQQILNISVNKKNMIEENSIVDDGWILHSGRDSEWKIERKKKQI